MQPRLSILQEQKIPMWSLKKSFAQLFKQRQLANNQHEISGLGYIATESAYRHGKPLVDRAQASLWKTHWLCRRWIAWKDPYPCHEALKEPIFFGWTFSAYPYSDDELHAKIHDQAKLIFEPWNRFWKRRKLACPPQCSGPFTPSLKKSPNVWWKLLQISVDFL